MSHRIVFIGAGNLATHLATELKSKGFYIEQVYSRSVESAAFLAQKLQTSYTTSPQAISPHADLYFVALKDAAFEEVLPRVRFHNKLVVHCSGSMPLSSLAKYSENIGVFYPLQTFSRERPVDFAEIPVFIEAGTRETEKILMHIAWQISDSVAPMDSEKRLYVHMAAVFACNFVNYCYSVASELVMSKEISFDVLKPLIMETARKVMDTDPWKAQTGPAVRFDRNIIEKHLQALVEFPGNRELYHSISKRIFEQHQKNR
jgi:predicted short-subunit dehydrogenase-like oxidoreductase (DUF2520 family)